MKYLIQLLITIQSVLGGYIHPDAPDQVLPYINNVYAGKLEELNHYEFRMRVQTRISTNPKIVITFDLNAFPNKVLATLTSHCKAEVHQFHQKVELDCIQKQNEITINLGNKELYSGSTLIRVFDIMNPNFMYQLGTGNFQIQTFTDETILVDQNLYFGTISIENASIFQWGDEQPTDIQAARKPNPKCHIMNVGTTLVGQQTNYIVFFKNSMILKKESWFRLTLPKVYYRYPDIRCYLIDYLEQVQNMDCEVKWNQVIIKKLEKELAVPTTYNRIKIINIYNPYLDGYTSEFFLQTLKPGVNTIIEHFRIPGTLVTPGPVFYPSISSGSKIKGQYVAYTFFFRPMNHLLTKAKISIYFPKQFTIIDTKCEILKGIYPVSPQQPVLCEQSNNELRIMNFARFRSSDVSVKIMANNPTSPGKSDHFQIHTYLFNLGKYRIVDKNVTCGQIEMTEIKEPYFMKLDMYTKYLYTPLDNDAPLDFRIYPNKQNTLPQTSNSDIGEIMFQLPIWWKNKNMLYAKTNQKLDMKGSDPLCMFGAMSSTKCEFTFATGTSSIFPLAYRIQTSNQNDPNRFSIVNKENQNYKVGLGDCDLPLSIQNAVVSPIPGNYDFRILLFKQKSFVNFDAVPLEMDQHTMKIPYPQFSSSKVYSSSTVRIDPYNFIRSQFTITLKIPLEGAIHFNFTIVDSNGQKYWTNDLGQSNNRVGCRIKIGSELVGFKGTSHPDLVCLIIKGDGSTTKHSIIQIKGFSKDVAANTAIEIDLANIKFCETLNTDCKLIVSTAYSSYLDNPYTMNQQEYNLGRTIQNTMSTENNQVSTSLSNKNICEESIYYLQFNNKQKLNVGDIVIVSFPSNGFIQKREGITSNFDNEVDVIIDDTNQQIYFILELVLEQNVNSNQYLYLLNVRNPQSVDPSDSNPNFPNSPFQGVSMTINIQQKVQGSSVLMKNNVNRFTFNPINYYYDGGIHNTGITIYPSWRTIEYDSWIMHKLTFSTCNLIPSNGAITIQLPFQNTNYYQQLDTKCQVETGIVTDGFTIDSKVDCTLNTDKYVITGFKQIEPYSLIVLILKIKSKSVDTSPTNWQIATWLDKTKNYIAHSVNNQILNEIDFKKDGVSALSMVAAVKTISSQKGKALQSLVFDVLLHKQQIVRVNTRGALKVQITPNLKIESSDVLVVQLDQSSHSINSLAILECRVNGQLTQSCQVSSDYDNVLKITFRTFKIQMPQLPTAMTIQSNSKTNVEISTKGIDYSATQKEGLDWLKAGNFHLKVQIRNNADSVKEFNSRLLEILPIKLTKFWIWSASKLRAQNTNTIDVSHDCSYDLGIEKQCGLSKYIFYMKIVEEVPAYDDASLPQISIEFSRQVGTVYTEGFARDLGTGILNGRKIPCEATNIVAKSGSTLSCKLLHGVKPYKTRVIMTGFDKINKDSLVEIHIPKIFNPKQSYQWVQGQIVIKKMVNNLLTPIMQNEYTITNNTYHIGNSDYPSISRVNLPASYNPKFDSDQLNTETFINIYYYSQYHQLGPSDTLIFQFPIFWQIIQQCTSTLTNNQNQCYGSPSSYQVHIQLDKTVASYNVQSGKIKIKTPQFKYLQNSQEKIYLYIYSRSKLANIFVYQGIQNILQARSITGSVSTVNKYINAKTEWSLTATLSHFVPVDGALQIDIPTEFTVLDSKCQNDHTSGSAIDSSTFDCNQDGNQNKFIAKIGAPGIPTSNKQIILKFALRNPSYTQISNKWKIYVFYDSQTPLNKLMSQNENIQSPVLQTSSTSGNQYWNTQYNNNRIIETSERQPFIVWLMTYVDVDFYSSSGNDYFLLQLPKQFTVPSLCQLIGYFDEQPSYQVTINTAQTNYLELKIQPPQNVKLLKDVLHRLVITTVNSEDGQAGLIYPSQQDTYSANIIFYDNNVITYENQISIFVPKKSFTKYASSALVTQAAEKTQFRVFFQPSVQIEPTGKLVFYVPTINSFNQEPLFDSDLGSSLIDGQFIHCDSLSNIVGQIQCQIKLGNSVVGIAAQISIKGWTQALKTDTLYSLYISQIKNFKYGNGFKHVYTTLEAYDASNTIINCGVEYDFTVIGHNIQTEQIAFKPFTDKSTSSSDTVQFNLKIKTPVKLHADNTNDYYIFEFDKQYFSELDSNCKCPSDYTCYNDKGNNWVVMEPKSFNIDANTLKDVQLTNCKQAVRNMQGGVQIKAISINRRKIRMKYTFQSYSINGNVITNIAFDVVPQNIGSQDNLNMNPKNKDQQYLISLQTPNNPLDYDIEPGSIVIIFPTELVLDSTDYICYNAHDSQLQPETNFKCYIDQTNRKFIVQNYKKLLKGTLVKLIVEIRNPVATLKNPSFEMKIYSDLVMNNLVAQKTTTYQTPDPYIPDIQGFKQSFFVSNQQQVRDVQEGERMELIFTFYLSQQYQAGYYNYFKVYDYIDYERNIDYNILGLDDDRDLECIFGKDDQFIYKASFCYFQLMKDTNRPYNEPQIFVYFPNNPILQAQNYYQLKITTRCSNQQQYKGLHFKKTGKYTINVDMYMNGYVVAQDMIRVDVYYSTFQKAQINWLFANKNQDVMAVLTFQPRKNIQANKGIIRIFLPQRNRDRSKMLFEAQDVSKIQVYRIKGIVPRYDRLQFKVENGYSFSVLIEIYGFQEITSSQEVQVLITGITNPNQDNSPVDILLQSIGDFKKMDVLDTSTLRDVFVPQDYQTQTDKEFSLIQSNSNIQAQKVNYKVQNIEGTQILLKNNYVVFELPDSFLIPQQVTLKVSPSTVTGSFQIYNNIMIYTFDKDLQVNKLDFEFDGMTNSYCQENRRIWVYLVKSHIFVKKYYKQLSYSYDSSSDFNMAIEQTTHRYSGIPAYYRLAITHNKEIPAYGFITIQFPSSVDWKIKNVIIYEGLALAQSVKIVGQQIQIELADMIYKPSKGIIRIYLEVINPAVGEYKHTDFIFNSYFNIKKQQLILTGTHSNSLESKFRIIADDYGPYDSTMYNCYAQMSPSENQDQIIQLFLNFQSTMTYSWYAGISIEIQVFSLFEFSSYGMQHKSYNFGQQTISGLKSHEVSYISGKDTFYSSGINNQSPQNIIVKNIKTTQKISSIYLRYKTHGQSIKYETCQFDLQKIKGYVATNPNPYLSHISKSEFNYFTVSFLASKAVQHPVGLLEFHDKSGKWPKDLLYASAGQYVPCKCDSQPDVYCNFSPKSNMYPNVRVYIHGLTALSVNSELKCYVYRFTNPASGVVGMSFSIVEQNIGNHDKYVMTITSAVFQAITISTAYVDNQYDNQELTVITNGEFQMGMPDWINFAIGQYVQYGDSVITYMQGDNFLYVPSNKGREFYPADVAQMCYFEETSCMVICGVTNNNYYYYSFSYDLYYWQLPTHLATGVHKPLSYVIRNKLILRKITKKFVYDVQNPFPEHALIKKFSPIQVLDNNKYLVGLEVFTESYSHKLGCHRLDMSVYSDPKLIGYKSIYLNTYDKGDIKMKMENKILYIYGHELLSKATHYYLLLLQNVPGTQSLCIENHAFMHTTATFIENGKKISTNLQGNLVYSAQWKNYYTFEVPQSNLAAQNGQLALVFQPHDDILKTQFIKLTKLASNGFQLQNTPQQLQCVFSDHNDPLNQQKYQASENCYIDNNNKYILIKPPYNKNLVKTRTYRLQIYFRYSVNQFTFPDNNRYQYILSVESSETTTDYKQYGIISQDVFKNYINGCLLQGLQMENYYSGQLVEFKTANAISSYSSGGFIQITFQTTKFENDVIKEVVARDLRLYSQGTFIQNDMKCNYLTGIMAEPNKQLQCQLIYGSSKKPNLPIIINIVNFNPIAANTQVRINIPYHSLPPKHRIYSQEVNTFQNSDYKTNKKPLDIFGYQYVGYSATYTAVSNAYTIGLPTITPTVIGQKNSFTLQTNIGTYYFHRLDGMMLKINDVFINKYEITVKMGSYVCQVHYKSNREILIYLPHKVDGFISGSVSFEISGLYNPEAPGSYFIRFNIYMIFRQIIIFTYTREGTMTFTAPAQSFTYQQQAWQKPNILKQTNQQYILTVKFHFECPANGALALTVPTQFTQIKDNFKIVHGYSGTQSSYKNGQILYVNIGDKIPLGSELKVQFESISPSTSGPTSFFTIRCYKTNQYTDYVASDIYVQKMNVMTTGKFKKVLFDYPRTEAKQIQAYDYGPLNLLYTPPINLKATDQLQIKFQSPPFWTNTVKSNAFYNMMHKSLYFDDIQCWWGEQIAEECEINSQGLLVYGPNSQTVVANEPIYLKFNTHRAIIYGLINENLQYPHKNDYQLTVKTTTKLLQVEYQRFKSFYQSSLVTNSYKRTILQFSIISEYDILQNLNRQNQQDNGIIRIQLLTADQQNNGIFISDLGTGLKNDVAIDCVCEQCSTQPLCSIELGRFQIRELPATIIVYPQQTLLKNTLYTFKFSRILNSQNSKPIIQIAQLQHLKYDQSVAKVQQSQLTSYFYYLTQHSEGQKVETQVPVFKPQNKIGVIENLELVFNNDVVIKKNSKDRIIIYTDTKDMLFRGTPSCQNFIVSMYKDNRIIEFKPTVDVQIGQTTLLIKSIQNMPYQMELQFYIKVWIDGNYHKLHQFPKTTKAVPNEVQNKQLSPTQVIISQQTKYEIKFKPTSRVPKDGYILVYLPECQNCDWKFVFSYCEATNVKYIDCQCIQSSSNQNYLKVILEEEYQPSAIISIEFWAQNPSTVVSDYSYFKVFTHYNNVGTSQNPVWPLIDQDLAFDKANRWSIQGGMILGLDVQNLYQEQHKLCAGQVGDVRFKFRLNSNTILKYPSDYLIIEQGVNANQKHAFQIAVSQELLVCLWSKEGDNNLQKVKTFRCELKSGMLDIYVPEEMQSITGDTDYYIQISDRYQNGGVRMNNPSGRYYFYIQTNKAQDKQMIELDVPECPFDSSSFGPNYQTANTNAFYVDSSCNQISKLLSDDKSTNDPTWNTIQFSLQTQINQIPASKTSNIKRSRILIELEIKNDFQQASWDKYIGYGPQLSLLTQKVIEIPCGGINKIFRTGQQSLTATPDILKCSFMVLNNKGVIVIENYNQIGANTRFDFFVAKVGNPDLLNTYSHLNIIVENMQDGQFVKLYQHKVYYLGRYYIQAPNNNNGLKSMLAEDKNQIIFKDSNQVGMKMGAKQFKVSNSGYNLNQGSLFQLEYSEPYSGVDQMSCKQYKVPKTDSSYNSNQEIAGMCGSSQSQRLTVIYNLLQQFVSNYNYLDVRDDKKEWMNPNYEYKDKSGIGQNKYYYYVYKDKQIIAYKHNGQSADRQVPFVVLQSASATNPIGFVHKVQLGIYLGTNTDMMGFMVIKITKNSFQKVDKCKVRKGLQPTNVLDQNTKIQCIVNSDSSHYLVEIDNFKYSSLSDGLLILELEVQNKNQQGWTDYIEITSYKSKADSISDIPKIIDQNQYAGGRMWIGKVTQSSFFRVYRNTKCFEDRRAKANDYGEMNLRMFNQISLPATKNQNKGSMKLKFPSDYTMPSGTYNMKCDLGNTDHTNYDNEHYDNKASSCKVNGQYLDMDTNDMYGLPGGVVDGKCSLIFSTSEGATGGDGYKLPPVQTVSSFEIYNYVNGVIVEQSIVNPQQGAFPIQDSDFEITNTIKEQNHGGFTANQNQMTFTNILVKFKTHISIPAGYKIDSTHPIGEIIIKLNTLDKYPNGYSGFPLDLGIPAEFNDNVPCRVIQGMIAPTGQQVQCKMIKSTIESILKPAQIVITNFQNIVEGSTVEIHFYKIGNIRNYLNQGQISIFVHQKMPDGSYKELIKDSTKYQPVQSKKTITVQNFSDKLTLLPQNNVGETMTFIFKFELKDDLNQDDYFLFRFNINYELKYLKESSIISNCNFILNSQLKGVDLITKIYAMNNQVNQISFIVPKNIQIPKQNLILTVSNMKNSAYATGGVTAINMAIIKQYLRTQLIQFTNVQQPSQGAPFRIKTMSISSYFSSDIDVKYIFHVITTYRIPINSEIIINMPNKVVNGQNLNYDHLGQSNPKETCQVSPSSSIDTSQCIQVNKIYLKVTAVIEGQIPINIEINRVRNPKYTGQINSDSFSILIRRPVSSSGLSEINRDYFNSLTFYQEKDIEPIYIKFKLNHYYRKVVTNYQFILQNTKRLPKDGQIIFTVPSNFKSQITPSYSLQVYGSWIKGSLSQTNSYDQVSGSLTINVNFEWPQGTTVYLKLDNLRNPDIQETGIFYCKTVYDSRTLDQSSVNDFSLKIRYLEPTKQIIVHSDSNSIFNPQNQAEISILQLQLSFELDILAESYLIVNFPAQYSNILTKSFYNIKCISISMIDIKACQQVDRQLIIKVGTNIQKNTKFEFKAEGVIIANTQSSKLQYDISLIYKNSVVSYSNHKFENQPGQSPQQLEFTKLTVSTNNLDLKSEYEFCTNLKKSFSKNSEVIVEFPHQYHFLSQKYRCELLKEHDTLIYENNSPSYKIDNTGRKMVIYGQQSGYTFSPTKQSLCYKITNIENPDSEGYAYNIIVSVYDKDQKSIIGKTYGTTSYPSKLLYQRQGKRIFVQKFTRIYQNMQSDLIEMKLQEPATYQIAVIPKSENDLFVFDPSQIIFEPYKPISQYFRVIPKKDTKLGNYYISYSKVENTVAPQFLEMSDSYFKYSELDKKFKIEMNQKVTETEIQGISMPIKVELNHPTSQQIRLIYSAIDTKMLFSPLYIIFEPGQTTKHFQYTSEIGSKSSYIKLEIDTQIYSNTFEFDPYIVAELKPTDYHSPEVVDFYTAQIDRTYVKIRISVSESAQIFYLLTLQGTQITSTKEVEHFYQRDPKYLSDVIEQRGKQYVNVDMQYEYFQYHSGYLEFNNLSEQTSYLLYFFVRDLSNKNSPLYKHHFTTLNKHNPAQFVLRLMKEYDVNYIMNVFGIVTHLQNKYFKLVNVHQRIKPVNELSVKHIIDKISIDYTFIIFPELQRNAITPMQQIHNMDRKRYLFMNYIPELAENYKLMDRAFEISRPYQFFNQTPQLIYVDEHNVQIDVRLQHDGKLFGIIIYQNVTTIPTAVQIKSGLNHLNQKLKTNHVIQLDYKYNRNDKNVFRRIVYFGDLYHITEYSVYLVGENDLVGNPDLMEDQLIERVDFKTKREVFKVPDSYIFDYVTDYIKVDHVPNYKTALLQSIKIFSLLILLILL